MTGSRINCLEWISKGILLVLVGLWMVGCAAPEERARTYLLAGQDYFARGDDKRAGIEFRNALKLKRDLVDAWRGIAKIEEKNQNWSALAPALRSVVELAPDDLDARLKLVRLLLVAGEIGQALPLVSSAEQDDAPAALVALRATILLAVKDYEGAVREAKRALAREPDNFDGQMVLANERLINGDAGAALRILNAVKATPEQAVVLGILKIQAYDVLGFPQQVEAELRSLIESDPKSSAFRKQLISFYMSRGRNDAAEAELRTIAENQPTNIEAQLDVVRFLNSIKGPDAAQDELKRKIGAGGDVFAYQLASAELEFSRGNYPASATQVEQLISMTTSPQQKLKAQVSLAGMHVAKKNFSAADPIIAQIMTQDQRSTEGLQLRATIRVERGLLDDAITDLRQALREQPKSVALLQLMALALERRGSIDLAEKELADATRVSGFNPDIGLKYVAFLRRRGSLQYLEDVLTELANRNPSDRRILTELAQVKLVRKDWIAAQDIANNIAKLDAQSGIADQIRAEALAGQNKLNESIQTLQNTFRAAPNATQPLVALVRAYVRAQRLGEAETLLQGVLRANPNSAEALALLGSLNVLRGAKQEAIANYQAAVERQPTSPVGYQSLAGYYASQGEVDKALTILRAGLEKRQDSFALQLNLALLLEQKKDYDGAIAQYEQILKEQPDSLVVANNLASLLSEYRSDQASLDRAQELAPILQKANVPHFKDTLGWLNYLKGDYRSALSLLQDAAEALPNLASVRYHLGMTYLKTGQPEKAQEELKKAMELARGDEVVSGKVRQALSQL